MVEESWLGLKNVTRNDELNILPADSPPNRINRQRCWWWHLIWWVDSILTKV